MAEWQLAVAQLGSKSAVDTKDQVGGLSSVLPQLAAASEATASAHTADANQACADAMTRALRAPETPPRRLQRRGVFPGVMGASSSINVSRAQYECLTTRPSRRRARSGPASGGAPRRVRRASRPAALAAR